MSHAIWSVHSAAFSVNDPERPHRARIFRDSLHEHGLRVLVDPEGNVTLGDASAATEVLGGAESEANLRTLQNYFNSMRNLATYATRAQFIEEVSTHVQVENRSVASHLRGMGTGVANMLNFMKMFLGKDAKNPVRFLGIAQNSTDYGQDPSLSYDDSETGTYHTLQTLGENQEISTWGSYIEDTPALRRYIRYVDMIARRWGMRFVYCPKEFNHLEELSTPVRPQWGVHSGDVRRTIQSNRYKLLFVSMAFEYRVFADLSVLETEVQPGQRPRQALQTDYGPIFVDTLHGIVKVLNTLGGFPSCKIYYKDYRNSVRSSQAAQ